MKRTNEPTGNWRADAPPMIMRMAAVVRFTGIGRSTIYKLVAQRRFPMPIRLGDRAVGWRRSDLERWSETHPSATH